jgi:hypothetical protein
VTRTRVARRQPDIPDESPASRTRSATDLAGPNVATVHTPAVAVDAQQGPFWAGVASTLTWAPGAVTDGAKPRGTVRESIGSPAESSRTPDRAPMCDPDLANAAHIRYRIDR